MERSYFGVEFIISNLSIVAEHLFINLSSFNLTSFTQLKLSNEPINWLLLHKLNGIAL